MVSLIKILPHCGVWPTSGKGTLRGVTGPLLGGGGGVGVFRPGNPGRGEATALGDTAGGAEATEDAAEDGPEALGLTSSASDMLARGSSRLLQASPQQPHSSSLNVLWRMQQHCSSSLHLLESSQ